MSSKGTLAKGEYTIETVEMAKKNKDFVMGFISQNKLVEDDPDFVYMSPGVNMSTGGDSKGQQYNSPHHVICNCGSDIIIVGRAIYHSSDPVAVAKEYKEAGWKAYLESLKM